MLCIALVAAFAFDMAGEAVACADAECTAICSIGDCDDHDGSTGAEHHCHGTAASETSISGSVLTQTALRAEPAVRTEFVASGYLDALERPPRASTAI